MMKEKELEIGRCRLYYERTPEESGIVINRFMGSDAAVEIPGTIDGLPVEVIARKAFLSKKTLKRIILPDTMKEVGDWAFAYCGNLERVMVGTGDINFGKAVFMECGRLKSIFINGKDEKTARLMAAAVKSDAYYLLDTKDAGSREWLEKWDARLLSVLDAPDSEGYSKQILCGEEDYGSTNLEEYMKEARRKKLRLILLRLLCDIGLSEKNREIFTEYCLFHTKGCGTEETWEVVLREHGEDPEYYGMFAEMGCLSAQNIGGILGDIGEEHPEMKAFFINYHNKKCSGMDFFDDLSL